MLMPTTDRTVPTTIVDAHATGNLIRFAMAHLGKGGSLSHITCHLSGYEVFIVKMNAKRYDIWPTKCGGISLNYKVL